jgi:hypothetical protein
VRGALVGWLLVFSFSFSYASFIYSSNSSFELFLPLGIQVVIWSHLIGTLICLFTADTYFGVSGLLLLLLFFSFPFFSSCYHK